MEAAYLLIGNGRVAHHFQHYFSMLGLSFERWHRAENVAELSAKLLKASHVLLLINDHAIENFITTSLKACAAKLVHCSGSLVTEFCYGAHPLMTFNHTLYEREEYLRIPFVIDDDAPAFQNLLPGLPNPHVRLAKNLKAKYHALCVLSGNFSCLLWQKLFDALRDELNLPHEIAYPYLQKQMQNLMQDYHQALTGPLQRGDLKTIEKNLQSLADDPYQQIYESFVNCYFNKG